MSFLQSPPPESDKTPAKTPGGWARAFGIFTPGRTSVGGGSGSSTTLSSGDGNGQNRAGAAATTTSTNNDTGSSSQSSQLSTPPTAAPTVGTSVGGGGVSSVTTEPPSTTRSRQTNFQSPWLSRNNTSRFTARAGVTPKHPTRKTNAASSSARSKMMPSARPSIMSEQSSSAAPSPWMKNRKVVKARRNVKRWRPNAKNLVHSTSDVAKKLEAKYNQSFAEPANVVRINQALNEMKKGGLFKKKVDTRPLSRIRTTIKPGVVLWANGKPSRLPQPRAIIKKVTFASSTPLAASMPSTTGTPAPNAGRLPYRGTPIPSSQAQSPVDDSVLSESTTQSTASETLDAAFTVPKFSLDVNQPIEFLTAGTSPPPPSNSLPFQTISLKNMPSNVTQNNFQLDGTVRGFEESSISSDSKPKKTSDAPSDKEKKTKRSKTETWECDHCGAQNSNDESECKGCKKRRGAGKRATGWGDTFKSMFHNKWKCKSCDCHNDDVETQCKSCDAPREGTDGTAKSPTVKQSKSPMTGSNGVKNSIFTFGTSSATKKDTGSNSKSAPFTFGSNNGNNTSNATLASADSSIKKGGFIFGAAPASDKKIEDAAATSTDVTSATKENKPFTFGINNSSTTSTSASSVPSGGFVFGKQSVADSAKSTAPKNDASGGFVFGNKQSADSATKAPAPSTAPAPFSFSSKAAAEAAPTPAPDASAAAKFSFGASSSKPENGDKKPFVFGAGNSSSSTEKKSESGVSSGFTFGSKPDGSKTPPPSFGSSKDPLKASDSLAPKTEPNFKRGRNDSSNAAQPFTFGASNAVAPPVSATTEGKPAFTFGAKTSAPPTDKRSDASFPTSSSTTEDGRQKRQRGQEKNATPAAPASTQPFTFGSKTPAPAPPTTSAITFGTAPTPAPATTFGATTSTNPNTQAAGGFGVQPAVTTTTQPNNAFGAPAPAPVPVPTFPKADNAFGAPASTPAFGASAPAMTPKTPSAPTFGSAPAPAASSAPTFGAAPAPFGGQTPGGGGFKFGAPSNQQSSASKPAISFGNAGGSNTFGGAPAPAAPQASGGAAAPAAPFQFGSSASAQPTTTPGGFGAAPTAPSAPAFGGTPAAPAAGGFSFGGNSSTPFQPTNQFTGAGGGTTPSTSFQFGGGSATPGPSGGGGFPQQPQQTSAPSFGGGTPATGGFGAPQATPNMPNSGVGFSVGTSSTTRGRRRIRAKRPIARPT